MWKLISLAVAGAALMAVATSAAEDSGISVTVDAEGPTPVGTGLKFLIKLYDDCSRKDGLTSCMKVKAATLLDRVARAGDIPISDALTLVRRDGSPRAHQGRAMSENELESTLPADSYEAKDAKLNELLWERAAKVLGSHSIQLNFPKMSASEMRGISSGGSGRGKMKGMMKMMMMGAAMGMMGMLPIMMGGVSMMALKALVVSKLALVLAIIMILKKLLGGGGGGGGSGGGHSGGGGWSSGGGGGGGYNYGGGGGGGGWDRRSFDAGAAQYMAYNAQVPSDSGAETASGA